ncbi:MAG: hypothetical protein R3A79_22625 [Nannocystaceae bacterium]
MHPAWSLLAALLFGPADPGAGFDHVRSAALSAGDEETGALTNGRHYYASNERDLHLVAADVRDRGGVLFGVAADPAYILAAWADADALILVDLDPAIVDLHRIYAAFFRAADDPASFRELWRADGRDAAQALLARVADDDSDAAALLATYAEAAPAIDRRFADLDARMAAHDTPWLLSDRALYRRFAELVRRGQVLALRGDLTRDGVIRDLGDWLREADLEVNVLYLSNVEQYFMYHDPFRANIGALPLADDSVVVRTLPGRPAGFEYILQGGVDFQTRVADPKVRSVYKLRGLSKGAHLEGRTRFEIAAPQAGR